MNTTREYLISQLERTGICVRYAKQIRKNIPRASGAPRVEMTLRRVMHDERGTIRYRQRPRQNPSEIN